MRQGANRSTRARVGTPLARGWSSDPLTNRERAGRARLGARQGGGASPPWAGSTHHAATGHVLRRLRVRARPAPASFARPSAKPGQAWPPASFNHALPGGVSPMPHGTIRGGLRVGHAQQTRPTAKAPAKGTAYLQ